MIELIGIKINRKTVIRFIVALVVIVAGIFVFRAVASQRQADLSDGLETVALKRSTLTASVEATGTVRSAQSAALTWETSGQVAESFVTEGETVTAGMVLAVLEVHTVPSNVILAQQELIEARKALGDLLESQLQQAQALKAVETAQQALEDAENPAMEQAEAQATLAEAASAAESAQRQLTILTTPPSDWSIQQAYSNMLLAEEKLNDINESIARIERQIPKINSLSFLSSSKRGMLKSGLLKTLKALEVQRAQTQLAYEKLQEKYNDLLAPPDPMDVIVAKAQLAEAQAQLAEAQRQWERLKDGPSEAEIAVLQAQLEDAQREWERLKDGPTPEDIAAAEARVAAAQATLNQMQITAPFDATITEVLLKPGDQVAQGVVAFRLDDLSKMLIDLQVSEVDINRIKVGQDVLIEFESVLAREYRGRVVEVAPVGVEVAGVVNFEVTVELLDADEAVRPGMTSDASILVGQVENALIVPSQAVRSLGGQRYVYVLKDESMPGGSGALFEGESLLPVGGARRTPGGDSLPQGVQPLPVEIGIVSKTHSEIIGDFLQEGDRVILNPPVEWLNISLGNQTSIEEN